MLTNIINTVKEYNKILMKKDIAAGLSVAAICLPQNMAYALIVGVEPIYGIYATIISMLVFTIIGQSSYLVIGPTNIMAMGLASSLNVVQQGNYLEALFLLTFLIGLCQLLFGLLKIGKLVNYVSESLIVALSTGAVIMIAVQQLQYLFGISADNAHNIYTNIYYFIRNINHINWYSLLLGLVTMGLILVIKRYKPSWPEYLIALIIVTFVVYLFQFEENIAVIGKLPSGIFRLNIVSFDWKLINTLLNKGLSIAFLGFIQTLAVSKSLTVQTKEEIDTNKEFISQGIINMINPFFSGFATAGSFTNSFANLQSGAATKLAQFFTSLTIILILILIKPIIYYVPITGLAGLVIVVAVGSIKIKEIRKNLFTTKGDALIFVVTFLSAVSLGSIDSAIYIGLLVSIGVLLKKSENIDLGIIKYDNEDKLIQKEVDDLTDDYLKDNCVVINMRGNLHFSSVNNLKKKFKSAFDHGDNFVIRLREIERMDTTILRELENFIDKVKEEGGNIILSGVDKAQYKRLKRFGITDKIGTDNIYLSEEKLFAATKEAYDEVTDFQ
ncbi:MAG: SulP family inorganic anion transporter [Halothermotrichaceae bacterium]